jgi:UDP-GlcNAc:undecaprenyl-phosphate GlcNAc-1-phosphate transferase
LSGLVETLPRLWLLLGCGTVLAWLGLCDDRRGLSWQFRLIVEVMVAAVSVTWCDTRLSIFIDVPAVGWLLSGVWIVLLINSFNMLDNMDALSGGIAAISSTMLAAVLLMNPDPATTRPQLFVAGLLLVLTGSLLGFLWHNRPPARIFMGDAGSYFIGFTIAVATLRSTYASYTSHVHAILTPLCVLAVPLYDLATVIWIRLREGRSPFQGDKSHFSHRLVELGMSKGQAVLTIYLTTGTCGLGALLLPRVDLVGAAVILLMVLCMLGLVAILESSARRKLKS